MLLPVHAGELHFFRSRNSPLVYLHMGVAVLIRSFIHGVKKDLPATVFCYGFYLHRRMRF